MKAMKQLSFAKNGLLPIARKQPRRVVFLAVEPRSRLEVLLELVYPEEGIGRPQMPLSTMLRIHSMRQYELAVALFTAVNANLDFVKVRYRGLKNNTGQIVTALC